MNKPDQSDLPYSPLLIMAAGAATLFIELALIRYVPGQIRVLGYFTTYVLLAAFLGIGLGMLAAGRWPRVSMIAWPAAMMVFTAVGLANFGSILHVRGTQQDFLFLEYQTKGIQVPLFPFLT